MQRHVRVVRTTNAEQLTDADLIGRMKRDEECLRVLVARHHVSLRRLAMSMLRSEPDADEAVQDTFISAHRNASSFRHESSVRTWLHSICYRACLGRLRRKRLTLVEVDTATMIAGAESDPAVMVAIDRAVAALPDDLRVAFTLVDICGFTREDAAALAGVPGNTMRARSARARMLLADALTAEEVVP